MYQASLKIFCFESWVGFWELIRKKYGRVKGVLAYLVSWKDIGDNVMLQKIVYIVVSRLS